MEKIKAFVKEELKNDLSGHDILHAERVVNNANKILKRVTADELIVITACYLHDTIDDKIFSSPDVQKEKIRILLKKENYTISQINEIIDIISTMSFRHGMIPQTINGQIVQDADRLDALGANGIIRTIQYGTSKGRPFYEKDNLRIVNGKYEFNQITQSTLSHFYEKLIKLPDLMNTKIAKELAEKRVNTISRFLNDFYDELN